MTTVEIAIQTSQQHTSFPRLLDIWQAADELGFAAAFTFDHFVPFSPNVRVLPRESIAGDHRDNTTPDNTRGATMPDGPQLEGWVTLTALSSMTRNMDVGVLVSGVSYRHPVVLAKMVVTLDHITEGRALLGLGAGGYEPDHAMYGFGDPGVGDRMTMLEETLEVFGLLCTAESPVDYGGRCVRMVGAHFDPKPIRPGGVPVVVGGNGERLRRIAARRADWYNGFWAPWEWLQINDGLDALLEHHGRHSGDLKRTAFVFSDLSGDPSNSDGLVEIVQATHGGPTEQALARIASGTPEHMITVLRSYAAAGVDMAILNIRPTQGAAELERFATNVLPAFTSRSGNRSRPTNAKNSANGPCPLAYTSPVH